MPSSIGEFWPTKWLGRGVHVQIKECTHESIIVRGSLVVAIVDRPIDGREPYAHGLLDEHHVDHFVPRMLVQCKVGTPSRRSASAMQKNRAMRCDAGHPNISARIKDDGL